MSQFPNSPSGFPTPPPTFGHGTPPGDGKATLAMVMGILSIFFGPLFGILGLVFAGQAKKEGNAGGKLTAAYVCSCVGLSVWVLFVMPFMACVGCAVFIDIAGW
ncbi:MAG: DUF4190 domain-containing protein [Defluviitaleaceae bacterium]|nr:DUF4190 domain-containing protein [Defluviitaleaceae bacterium]